MTRGEVWWAELAPPVGRRPVVILTRNAVLPRISSIVVCLVTTTIRGLRTELSLGRSEGLPQPSVASMDNIITIPKNRLIRLLGSLSRDRIAELNTCLKFALEIE